MELGSSKNPLYDAIWKGFYLRKIKASYGTSAMEIYHRIDFKMRCPASSSRQVVLCEWKICNLNAIYFAICSFAMKFWDDVFTAFDWHIVILGNIQDFLALILMGHLFEGGKELLWRTINGMYPGNLWGEVKIKSSL